MSKLHIEVLKLREYVCGCFHERTETCDCSHELTRPARFRSLEVFGTFSRFEPCCHCYEGGATEACVKCECVVHPECIGGSRMDPKYKNFDQFTDSNSGLDSSPWSIAKDDTKEGEVKKESKNRESIISYDPMEGSSKDAWKFFRKK